MIDTEKEVSGIIYNGVSLKLADSGGITPSGSIYIPENGLYDVTQYAEAIVNISSAEDSETNTAYVKTEALGISNALEDTSGDFKILFCTDLHWQGNDSVPHAAQAIKAITRMSDIDLVVFGGDYIANWQEVTKATALSNIKSCRDTLANIPCKTLWLRGNHDTNGYPSQRLTRQECFNAVASDNVANGAVINSSDPYGNYGYIDFPTKKIRVVFCNTSDNDDMAATAPASASDAAPLINCHNLTSTQMQWLADNAFNFSEDGWKVIFVSHLPFFFSHGSSASWYNSHTYFDGTITWTCSLKNMSDIVKAYIDKTAINFTHNGESVSKDFSSLAHYADIMGGVNGHGHSFWVDKDSKVKYIMVGNACNGGEKVSSDGNTYTKTVGTANDTTFDVVAFDTANKLARTVNYGRVYNRIINLKSGYTNLLPIIGYNDNKRLSTSSGDLRDASGRVTTGFIDVSAGDVIRIKGLTFPSAGEGTRAICSYNDTTSAFISGSYLHTALASWPPFTFNFDGDLLTITMSQTAGAQKIRVCGDAITGSNLIITRNEVIL